MAYTWSKTLETGHQATDAQHKQLVDTFNSLMSACVDKKGHAELENTLKFLCAYTVKHFNDEELWQRECNFPEYQKHKLMHDGFKVTATGLYERFRKEGPTVNLIIQFNTKVGGWLINHILKEDSKIGLHAKTLNISA